MLKEIFGRVAEEHEAKVTTSHAVNLGDRVARIERIRMTDSQADHAREFHPQDVDHDGVSLPKLHIFGGKSFFMGGRDQLDALADLLITEGYGTPEAFAIRGDKEADAALPNNQKEPVTA